MTLHPLALAMLDATAAVNTYNAWSNRNVNLLAFDLEFHYLRRRAHQAELDWVAAGCPTLVPSTSNSGEPHVR